MNGGSTDGNGMNSSGINAGGKAVIIDDSPVLAVQLQSLLQAQGFEAVHCSRPAELSGRPACIFTELLQLDNNGFRILRALREHFDCPLILVSGTGRLSDQHWGRQAGAMHVLTRPLRLQELRKILKEPSG